ncbi:MAG: transposase [Bacteroidetes bacterium]|nr:transposase [Bacteroidota bacterium]
MTTVKLALDNHPKPDGTCHVVLRIVHFRKPAQVITGIAVKPEYWDEEARCITPSYRGTQSVTRLNNYLLKKQTLATDKITKLDEAGRLTGMTAKQIKQHLEGKKGTQSFFAFATELIEAMEKAQQIGNARVYSDTVAAFRNFNKGRDLTFREINYDFLTDFETAHYAKGNKVNGLSVYLRTVRAIYNKAIKKGLVDADLYPFKLYEIKGKRTGKKAMPESSVKTVVALTETQKRKHQWVRHFFLLMYFLRGMSFVDLAYLKMKYMNHGRLKYDRRKTGSPLDIEIPPQAKDIIDLYAKGKGPEDYILPCITSTDPKKQYYQVLDKRRKFNKILKEFAPAYGLPEEVSSSVIRNTFATRANDIGIPLTAISEFLGHKDLRTTQRYLDSLPKKTTDEYSRKVFEL